MPVDRGLVEVRPELPPGVLGVPGEVGLAAEADDGLLLAAVAVVGVALPVELDEPHVVLFGPEDVVGEVAVTVVRGLLGDLRSADRAVPDERRHVIQGTRDGGEALQRGAELPLPVHHVLAPQPVQQVVVLQGQRQALADVLAEPREDRGGIAAAEHQVHPALAQVLQHRVLLGDAHRVVRRDQRGAGGEDQALGGGRDVGQQGGRRGGEERRVVVLADREHVEPDLLGLLRDRHDGVDPLRLARRLARDGVPGDVADREDSELHGTPLALLRYMRLHVSEQREAAGYSPGWPGRGQSWGGQSWGRSPGSGQSRGGQSSACTAGSSLMSTSIGTVRCSTAASAVSRSASCADGEALAAEGGRDRPEVGPVERRDRRVHVLVAELDVLGAVGPVVHDEHHYVHPVAHGGAELGQAAEHEPAVTGDHHDGPPGRPERRADRVGHAQADGAEVEGVDEGVRLGNAQRGEGVPDEAAPIKHHGPVGRERLVDHPQRGADVDGLARCSGRCRCPRGWPPGVRPVRRRRIRSAWHRLRRARSRSCRR